MRNILLTLICLVLAACAPEFIPGPDPTPIAVSTPGTGTARAIGTSISTPDKFDTIATKMPERVPPTNAFSPISGEVPTELLDSILKDVVGRTGVAPDKIVLIQAQATIWNDGSMGCSKPGEFYTQALVNGYRVILEIDGKTYDYRASDRGYFFLCESEFPPNLPPGTPGS